MFSLKICECSEKEKIVVRRDNFNLKSNRGMLKIQYKNTLDFCEYCEKPHVSKKEAREIIRRAVEKTQRDKGFLTGKEIRQLRTEAGMLLREYGELLNIHYSKISALENGYEIQTKVADQVIRMKSQEYIVRNHPSRKKLKEILAHSLQSMGDKKILLNKMMFYIDFWQIKRYGKSITGSKYTPLQGSPFPKDYHEIIQEMIEDKKITAIEGHRFRVNKDPDMSGFSKEEMASINDIIALAKNDKGKKIFNLPHEEKGFLETPLYEIIPYEYAKDLKIEELLNEIAETG